MFKGTVQADPDGPLIAAVRGRTTSMRRFINVKEAFAFVDHTLRGFVRKERCVIEVSGVSYSDVDAAMMALRSMPILPCA